MSLKWYEHVSGEELSGRGQQYVIKKWETERRRYCNFMLRMSLEILLIQVLCWARGGSRRRGRPEDTCRKTIMRDERSNELTDENIQRVAYCKEKWTRFFADLFAN